MPGVPERSGAEEGQRDAGLWGELHPNRARPRRRQRPPGQARSGNRRSIRTHTTKHFPVQQTAHATYRKILERRARENQVDFVDGVAIALTPIAFYEVVMNKAFRTLVDDRTEVSLETGPPAAEKLQSVLDGRQRGADVLELKVQLGQI